MFPRRAKLLLGLMFQVLELQQDHILHIGNGFLLSISGCAYVGVEEGGHEFIFVGLHDHMEWFKDFNLRRLKRINWNDKRGVMGL